MKDQSLSTTSELKSDVSMLSDQVMEIKQENTHKSHKVQLLHMRK